MNKIKATCKECQTEYEFLNRWLSRNDPKKFICRNCKIKKTTQSKKFKHESKERSLEKLASSVVKSKMSMIATINNAKNADKISKSLRKFYQDSKNKSDNSNRVKKLWKSKNYREDISNKIKNKWLDDDYRIKVLTAKDKKEMNLKFGTRDHNDLKKKLTNNNIRFEENYYLGIHKFNFFINNKILIDLEENDDKKLFVEHYFKQYKYQTDYAS
jgi:hypothetical protein